MRFRFSLVAPLAVLVAGTIAVAGWNGGNAAPRSGMMLADKRPDAMQVDTELVLAVDVSYSMDPEEQQLQREGYIAALTSREFMDALKGGINGKVAVTYFEWAGPFDHRIIVPWRLIDGPAAADRVVNEIARASYRRASRTSISSALQFAKPLFDASGYNGIRRVIDVSGDGANNSGPFIGESAVQLVNNPLGATNILVVNKERFFFVHREYLVRGSSFFASILYVLKDIYTYGNRNEHLIQRFGGAA